MLDISEHRRSRPRGREQQERLRKGLSRNLVETRSQPRRTPTRAR
tara:strand:+ start:352 stop:486 length:135 start_codon:yes stop_codon:yes gene_type:complete